MRIKFLNESTLQFSALYFNLLIRDEGLFNFGLWNWDCGLKSAFTAEMAEDAEEKDFS